MLLRTTRIIQSPSMSRHHNQNGVNILCRIKLLGKCDLSEITGDVNQSQIMLNSSSVIGQDPVSSFSPGSHLRGRWFLILYALKYLTDYATKLQHVTAAALLGARSVSTDPDGEADTESHPMTLYLIACWSSEPAAT